ncbi:MAG: hypothetical protein HPY64_00325 [Anaerolineae bacterium]|nr:hypothetical protein [Anaerolineae bacterium]
MDEVSVIQTLQGVRLRVIGEAGRGFHGEEVEPDVWVCPLDADNAVAVRRLLPWTAPVPAGLRQSIGLSDRLGLAVPGLLRVARQCGLFPVLAQQSIQEMGETGRTPQEVIDAATWEVLAAGDRDGYGADVDGLQTTAMIDLCVEAGFTSFTLEPQSCFLNLAALTDPEATLDEKFAALPWEQLAFSPERLLATYRDVAPAGLAGEEAVKRIACAYGPAIVELTRLAGHLGRRLEGRLYDLEINPGGGSSLLSPLAHRFIAAELLRRGVRFTSLVLHGAKPSVQAQDAVSDLEMLCAAHVGIARELGPYKLTVRAGPEGCRVYPILARYAGSCTYLKITGVDWLVALRVIAAHEPALLRAMLAHALQRYARDGAVRINQVPVDLPDDRLPEMLDQADTRQILLVMFGELLRRFRAPILAALHRNRAAYAKVLEAAVMDCIGA